MNWYIVYTGSQIYLVLALDKDMAYGMVERDLKKNSHDPGINYMAEVRSDFGEMHTVETVLTPDSEPLRIMTL